MKLKKQATTLAVTIANNKAVIVHLKRFKVSLAAANIATKLVLLKKILNSNFLINSTSFENWKI